MTDVWEETDTSVRARIREAFAQIEELYQRNDPDVVLERTGSVIALLGERGRCRSAVARWWLQDVATTGVYASQQLTARELMLEWLCAEARLLVASLETGRITEQEWARLIRAAGHLSASPLWIEGERVWEVEQLREVLCERADEERWLVVEELELVEGEDGAVMRGLKRMAREVGAVILVGTQSRRAVGWADEVVRMYEASGRVVVEWGEQEMQMEWEEETRHLQPSEDNVT